MFWSSCPVGGGLEADRSSLTRQHPPKPALRDNVSGGVTNSYTHDPYRITWPRRLSLSAKAGVGVKATSLPSTVAGPREPFTLTRRPPSTTDTCIISVITRRPNGHAHGEQSFPGGSGHLVQLQAQLLGEFG